MAEYICRDEVMRKFLERGSGYITELTMRDMINEIPTADVQPVKRGKWEIFWQNGKPKLKCTNCHSLFDIRTNDKHICIYPKFCEECGADMRNKEENENDTL